MTNLGEKIGAIINAGTNMANKMENLAKERNLTEKERIAIESLLSDYEAALKELRYHLT